MHRTTPGFTFLLVLLLIGVGPLGSHASAQVKEPEEERIVQVYKKVAPSTVFIASAYVSPHHLTGDRKGGIGSGVILDRQGMILTNAHVVDGAAKIMVVLHDGTRLPADVVGIDQVSDIALLRISLPSEGHYTVAELGDSGHAQIGQRVLAIGNPFGLGYALTTGVISGFGATPGREGLGQERVIQTSAAMNPGNSGGPLVDREGRVIGITTAILVGAQNIGFAIPINTAKTIMAELRDHGHVVRPWIGVRGTWLSGEVINLFALPLAEGILVEDVDEGSPAEKAGLRAGMLDVTIERESVVLGGDIIKTIDGADVTTPEQFVKVMKALRVGQTTELHILRDGESKTIMLITQELPVRSGVQGKPSDQERMGLRPSRHESETFSRRSTPVRF